MSFIRLLGTSSNKLKVLKRRLIGFWLLFIVALGVAGYFFVNSTIERVLSQERQIVQVTYDAIIQRYSANAELMYRSRINQPDVIAIYQQLRQATTESQRALLRAQLSAKLEKLYMNMHLFKMRQLHFHLPDNSSFLRFHKPSKHGDSLVGIRATVEYVNKNQQPISGFEEGRIFNGYRFVYPLGDGQQHLGSVEMSISMKNIVAFLADELQAEYDFLIRSDVVRSKLFDEQLEHYQVNPVHPEFMRERGVSNSQSKIMAEFVNQSLLSEWADQLDKPVQSSLVFDGTSPYVVTIYPVKNAITQDNVAFVVLARAYPEILYEILKVGLFSLIVLLLIAAIVWNLIQKFEHNQQLHKYLLIHKKVEQIGRLGSWEFEFKGERLAWSDEVYRIFAEEPQSFSPSFEKLLEYIHPDDREQFEKIFQKSIEDKSAYELEHRVVCADGKELIVREKGEHYFNDKGQIERTIGTVQDVTAIRSVQQQLSQERYERLQLLDNLPEIVYRAQCHDEKKVIFVNKAVKQILGHSANALMSKNGRSLESFILERDFQAYHERWLQALQDKQNYQIEYRVSHVNGDLFWVQETIRFYQSAEGCFIDGIIKDITMEKESILRLEKLINQQDNLIALTSGEQVEFMNQTLLNFLGVQSVEQFLQSGDCICRHFVKEDGFFYLESDGVQSWVQEVRRLPESRRIVLMKNHHGIHHVFHINVSAYDASHSIMVLTDITLSYHEKQKLEHISQHDSLTGAYNREHLNKNYRRYLTMAQRNSRMLALVMFDVDHFKQINDVYGHNQGDSVLRELVELVTNSIRIDDFIVRWGGEEFMLICNVNNLSNAELIAESVRKRISEYSFKGIELVTCSFGVTIAVPQESLELVVDRADKALYQSKNSGRNCVTSME